MQTISDLICSARGIELWRKNPYVGGKGGTGYGKIQICYAMPAPDHDPYRTYLDEHRDAVVASLQDLEERIGK